MTRLLYTLMEGYCELAGGEFSRAGELLLTISGVQDGTLIIGDRYYRLVDGSVKTDISALGDGEISPTLLLNKKLIPLEPFSKKEGRLMPQKTKDFVLIILLARVSKLEAETSRLSDKTDELDQALGVCRIIDRE